MKLGVNIDHVATLRQQRRGRLPEPLYAGLVAQENGADSIVVHLREDRRHIQESDVRALRQSLDIPLALEMAATEAMGRFAVDIAPQRVCLVPEKRQELTTEGGLNVVVGQAKIKKLISRLAVKNVESSLFLDPDEEQIRCAKSLGASMVELHTGRYAEATSETERDRELSKLARAAELIVRLGMRLHAGHGLTYRNVAPIARLPGMEELNIGFSIISQAIFSGLGMAVREMKAVMASSHADSCVTP